MDAPLTQLLQKRTRPVQESPKGLKRRDRERVGGGIVRTDSDAVYEKKEYSGGRGLGIGVQTSSPPPVSPLKPSSQRTARSIASR